MIKVEIYLAGSGFIKSYFVANGTVPLLLITDSFITIEKEQYHIVRRSYDIDGNVLQLEVNKRYS